MNVYLIVAIVCCSISLSAIGQTPIIDDSYFFKKQTKTKQASKDSIRNRPNLFISTGYITGNLIGNSALGEVKVVFPAAKVLKLGLGMEIMKLTNLKELYLPVFLDVLPIFGKNYSKPVLYGILQPGYGIYNERTSATNVRGSDSEILISGNFYFGGGLGMLIPTKSKVKINLQAKFNRSYFEMTSKNSFPQTETSSIFVYNSGSFLVGVGF